MIHSKRSLRIATITIPLVLSACSRQARPPEVETPPRHGDVSYRAVTPDDGQTKHYQLEPGQEVEQPTVVDHPPPAYPVELLVRQPPPAEIAAQLAVNGEGRVYNVIVADEAQADPTRRAFIAAVRQATLNWHFTPLIINHIASDGMLVRSERPPFSQFFLFRFEQHDGKPVSTMQSAVAPTSP